MDVLSTAYSNSDVSSKVGFYVMNIIECHPDFLSSHLLLSNTPHGRRRNVTGVSGSLNEKLGFEIIF